MPGVSLPPDQTASLERTVARIEHRERIIKNSPRAQVWMPHVFSYAGPLEDTVESAPWFPEHSITIYRARLSATQIPVGGDVTLELRLNGSDFVALTLTDSTATQINPITGLIVPSESFITLRTDAGQAFGAGNLSVGFLVAPL